MMHTINWHVLAWIHFRWQTYPIFDTRRNVISKFFQYVVNQFCTMSLYIYILANQHTIFFSEFVLKSISDDVPIYIIWSIYLSVFGLHFPIRHMLGVVKGLLARPEWVMLIKIRHRHIITIYLVVTCYWWKSSNLAFSTPSLPHSLTHSLTHSYCIFHSMLEPNICYMFRLYMSIY